jgi:asparagine synthase (glutamine-hydrolysing)
MCGIGGVMYADPAHPIEPQVLVGMAAIQHHRGPDGFGCDIVEGRGVGFTHARLSIIDLNPERAAALSLGGRAVLIAHNGEFTTTSDCGPTLPPGVTPFAPRATPSWCCT